MRKVIGAALDTLGLLLVAGGLAGGLWAWLGWWSLAPAGLLLIAGVQVHEFLETRGG